MGCIISQLTKNNHAEPYQPDGNRPSSEMTAAYIAKSRAFRVKHCTSSQLKLAANSVDANGKLKTSEGSEPPLSSRENASENNNSLSTAEWPRKLKHLCHLRIRHIIAVNSASDAKNMDRHRLRRMTDSDEPLYRPGRYNLRDALAIEALKKDVWKVVKGGEIEKIPTELKALFDYEPGGFFTIHIPSLQEIKFDLKTRLESIKTVNAAVKELNAKFKGLEATITGPTSNISHAQTHINNFKKALNTTYTKVSTITKKIFEGNPNGVGYLPGHLFTHLGAEKVSRADVEQCSDEVIMGKELYCRVLELLSILANIRVDARLAFDLIFSGQLAKCHHLFSDNISPALQHINKIDKKISEIYEASNVSKILNMLEICESKETEEIKRIWARLFAQPDRLLLRA